MSEPPPSPKPLTSNPMPGRGGGRGGDPRLEVELWRPQPSRHSREPVEHEAAGDGDVEARARPDHRKFRCMRRLCRRAPRGHRAIRAREGSRCAVGRVPGAGARSRPRRVRRRRSASRRRSSLDPAVLTCADPVDARMAAVPEGVAVGERLAVVRLVSGTAMQPPTASHVRRSVPRLAWKATHSGATTRWSQQLCRRCRRPRRMSRGRDFAALNAPGRMPFHRSCAQRYRRERATTGSLLLACLRTGQRPSARRGRGASALFLREVGCALVRGLELRPTLRTSGSGRCHQRREVGVDCRRSSSRGRPGGRAPCQPRYRWLPSTAPTATGILSTPTAGRP